MRCTDVPLNQYFSFLYLADDQWSSLRFYTDRNTNHKTAIFGMIYYKMF